MKHAYRCDFSFLHDTLSSDDRSYPMPGIMEISGTANRNLLLPDLDIILLPESLFILIHRGICTPKYKLCRMIL